MSEKSNKEDFVLLRELSNLREDVTALESQDDNEAKEYTSEKTPISTDTKEELLNFSTAELTVENLQRYEKETSPLAKEELILKQSYDESLSEKKMENEPHQSLLKPVPTLVLPTIKDIPRIAIPPSRKSITKGLKLSGEEYEAVSIDVQTDESWLNGNNLLAQEITEEQSDQLTTTQVTRSQSEQPANHEEFLDRPVTPDVEVSSCQYATQEITASVLPDSDEEAKQSQHSQKLKLASEHSTSAHNEAGDYGPLIEVNLEDFSVFASDKQSGGDFNVVQTVSPPFILQYKRESQEVELDYEDIKPPVLPTVTTISDMEEDDQEYYYQILEESKERQKKLAEEAPHLINIAPHDAFRSMQKKKEEKEKAAAKSKAKENEKRKQLDTQTANQASFYSFARQLKTINYALSSEKCMDEGWTVKPKSPEPPIEPAKEFFVQEPGTSILSGKRYQRAFVQKHYDNGNIFLIIFSDGSGTVWYSSGNIAISIIATEKQGKLIFVIHEDKEHDENPNVQAVFKPDGNCTCYYPDGNIRTNLNPFGGEYYSLRGERTKRWQWRDKETHVHAPPFQPITFGLSKHVGVRIIAQESIFVTFTDGRRSVRFNVGTKLRIKSGFSCKENFIDLNSLLLEDRIVYVQTLLQRFYSTFQFPHSPRRAQIKLPHYLHNKLDKISKLRSSIEKLPPIKESVTFMGPTNLHSSDLLLPSIPSKPKRRKTKVRVVRNVSTKHESQFAVTVN